MNKKQEKIQQFLKIINDNIEEYGVDGRMTLGEIREIFEEIFIKLSNEDEPEEDAVSIKEPFFVSRDEILQVQSTMTPNKFIDWLHEHYEISPMIPILTDEDLKEIDKWMKEHKD